MVKVSNQGLDDRYIRLLSNRPLYPGVGIASVSFDHVYETRFSNVRLDILKFSFHNFWTKFPFNRVSNKNWFLGHDHARVTRLVWRRAISSRINRFRLDLFSCCKSISCCNLDSFVFTDQEPEKKTRGATASFLNASIFNLLRGFRICRQFVSLSLMTALPLIKYFEY